MASDYWSEFSKVILQAGYTCTDTLRSLNVKRWTKRKEVNRACASLSEPLLQLETGTVSPGQTQQSQGQQAEHELDFDTTNALCVLVLDTKAQPTQNEEANVQVVQALSPGRSRSTEPQTRKVANHRLLHQCISWAWERPSPAKWDDIPSSSKRMSTVLL